MAATETQLRLLVSDPLGVGEILSTGDYASIIAIEDNLYRAAALAARTISATFAEKIKTDIKGVSIENQEKFDHYESLANSYDKRAAEGGDGGTGTTGIQVGGPSLTGISNDEMKSEREDTDRYQGAFVRDQMNNPPGSITNNTPWGES